MRSLITCMGEILVDFLPVEEEGRTVGFMMHAGGSPYNVAMGLARLGRQVAFAGKASNNLFGRFLFEHAATEGIDTRFLLAADAPSTLAFVAVQNGEPAYAFYAEGAADTTLTREELPAALVDETAMLAFGSISLLQGTTPGAVLSTAEQLKGKALLHFDPNIRPSLVRDEAAYRTLLAQLFGLADVIKVSAEDLAWLAPGRSIDEALGTLRQYAPALLVVTRGSRGVLALRGDDNWSVPIFPVQTADTVGAGDTFTAGLLTALSERGIISAEALLELPGDELLSCLRFASAAAALTCTRPGADPPRRAEVVSFLAEQPTS